MNEPTLKHEALNSFRHFSIITKFARAIAATDCNPIGDRRELKNSAQQFLECYRGVSEF